MMHTHCYKNGTVMMSAISDSYLCSLCEVNAPGRKVIQSRKVQQRVEPHGYLACFLQVHCSWCVKYTGRTPNGRINLYQVFRSVAVRAMRVQSNVSPSDAPATVWAVGRTSNNGQFVEIYTYCWILYIIVRMMAPQEETK